MPQFNPEEEKVAIATFPTKPAGLECTAELWLASDMTKVATSDGIPFTATGVDKSISLPITLPGVEGTYPVYLEVFSNGQRIAVFLGDEDVVIVPAAPPVFTFGTPSAKRATCPYATAWPYLESFQCTISNQTDTTQVHRIQMKYDRYSRTYGTWEYGTVVTYDYDRSTIPYTGKTELQLGLLPGESYSFPFRGIIPMSVAPYGFCNLLMALHYDYYFYLEDELGNQSPKAHIYIP